ncbi:hypothetical protein [Hansschlegelia sp.]|uniref:hypothetical protein n=1 Tax=Hansschlegelia sp. TaxID=2041892 RepID=UPI002B7DC896|nr:hypothetical protein [Hansschlegelia sp.]HVI27508.1 hypothetical protein [Hansschlegelia sp.]
MTEPAPLHPVTAAQIESARRKVEPQEMIDVIRDQAWRINGNEKARVALGHKPDPAEIRRMVVFDAVADRIERGMQGAGR